MCVGCAGDENRIEPHPAGESDFDEHIRVDITSLRGDVKDRDVCVLQ